MRPPWKNSNLNHIFFSLCQYQRISFVAKLIYFNLIYKMANFFVLSLGERKNESFISHLRSITWTITVETLMKRLCLSKLHLAETIRLDLIIFFKRHENDLLHPSHVYEASQVNYYLYSVSIRSRTFSLLILCSFIVKLAPQMEDLLSLKRN